MRRSDRAITIDAEIAAILEKCQVLTIGLNDVPVPYLLPVNFGMEPDGKTLYIHGAAEGTKYDLLKQNNHVSFTAFCPGELEMNEAKKMCTMRYESVCGRGTVEELLDEEEKYHALVCILAHYRQQAFPVNPAVVPATRVLRLQVEEWTGKRRR